MTRVAFLLPFAVLQCCDAFAADPTPVVETVLLKPTGNKDHHAESVAFSPDGKLIVSTAGVWDVQTRKLLVEFPKESHLGHRVGFSLDGTRVLRTSEGGDVLILDPNSGKQLTKLVTASGVRDFVLAKKYVFVGSPDNTIEIFNLESGERVDTLKPEAKLKGAVLQCVATNPDGTYVAAGYDRRGDLSGDILIWDVKQKAQIKHIKDIQHLKSDSPMHPVTAIALSPDGAKVCSIGWHGNVQLWDVESGKEQKRIPIGYHPSHLATSTDFKSFAATDHDGFVAFGELGGKDVVTKKILNGSARGVAISANKSTLAIGDESGNIRLFEVSKLK